ncbi:hypothetical protein RI129_013279 [Pyrocoelia pectoralis]|uniref:Ribosomal RNA processing protein 1 homolog n=1 Tax=Pyrocoelia pectoralis TaxID=417401 RepID=A0AAN7V7X4_9COLE
MENSKNNQNNEEKRKLLLSHDMKFVKALAGNEKKIRDRALKNLKGWFTQRSSQIPFTQDDFLRIWKGLFTSMWMSDKPLIQEECAETISTLIHYVDCDSALLFFKCGLMTMAIEWFGIDQWRLDKFLMLVRRMLRQCFEFLKKTAWNLTNVKEFNNVLTETILKTDNSKHLGLTMHVSNGKITHTVLIEFLKPFVQQLILIDDKRQSEHLSKCIFHHLIRQSDEGLEYEAKFSAWKRQGFPGGTLDVMEKMEVDSDDEDEDETVTEVLDARAGHVDVLLPQLKFNPSEVVDLLQQFKFTEHSTTHARKAITTLQQKFAKLAEGVYPLGLTKVSLPKTEDFINVDTSLEHLTDFERQLRIEKRELNNRGVPPNGKLTADIGNNKRKKIKHNLDTKLNGGHLFMDKLRQFVNKSEGRIIKRKLLKTEKPIKDNVPQWSYESSFIRNSGTWEVHKFNLSMTESPPAVNKRLVAENTWTELVETEPFVASAKSKLKGKRLMCETPVIARRLVNNVSEKKVRIALKLNKTQEIHEHVAQLKSSPGIPYDADRKPDKPLLKPNAVRSPINPFYKHKRLTL